MLIVHIIHCKNTQFLRNVKENKSENSIKEITNYRLKKNRNMKEEIQKISINKTESKSGTNPSPTISHY